MRTCFGVFLACLVLFLGQGRAEEQPGKKTDDTPKDLEELQGTWQLESMEQSKKSTIDLQKRQLFVGGNLIILREGNKVIQAGIVRLTESKAPRTMNVVVRQGEHQDNTMLGIYELKGDKLKVCFDPEGETRPKQFATREDSSVYVAVYKRVKRKDEDIEIRGRYRCDTYGLDGKKQTLTAYVQRHGDAYSLRWEVPGGVAFIGTGIRQGNTLSVCWVNRGSVGISVFQIEKGPRLVGTYTELGGAGLIGREILTAEKSDFVEVSHRP